MHENNYEGARFKDTEAFDYYAIVGSVPGAEFEKPAWGILDEEDGGYIAFCTDEASAIKIADALNDATDDRKCDHKWRDYEKVGIVCRDCGEDAPDEVKERWGE